ncbi:RNA polymerase II transcription factor B subunit 4 [Imshaugia aleurites]|uniref:General transcription and DNA repair factor IIH subunit TFB4 n=1 Tax=Imshaugia aleurites TaxID=172621 RepID=A0A8H3FRF8_9LECA|nr:RNA polymerase II transcription factor B subunit 4 [Imshaugia aleurites]
MNAVDGSDHYNKTSDGKWHPQPPPSLLTIILDTNPHAWALLSSTLPLSVAIANLLVFINAHLAFNNSNKVAIIASHTQRAEFLYPIPSQGDLVQANGSTHNGAQHGLDGNEAPTADDANHYRPFRHIQTTLLSAISKLYKATTPESLTPTTSIAGALTLALTYINKQSIALSSTTSSKTNADPLVVPSDPNSVQPATLNPRILILSVSGDLAHQYIPIMNTIFACQRLTIPIDICKIAGDSVFLQQASDATHGTYIALTHPRGLLQYFMLGFLPDQSSRKYLVSPTAVGVDFRAACFCHRKVVDVGFVCSICLSIFCSPPEGAECLTCGTHLRLGEYGGKPAVLAKRKKKRKKGTDE